MSFLLIDYPLKQGLKPCSGTEDSSSTPLLIDYPLKQGLKLIEIHPKYYENIGFLLIIH